MLAHLAALFQVVFLDLALAADNAVAVGLAAAALPQSLRKRAIFWGVSAALVLRIIFALLTVYLLKITGLLLVGGLALIWVAWRMWKDLRSAEEADAPAVKAQESFRRALVSIIVADVSMSLDNVLAVAGVARNTPVVLTIGLVLSVALMAVAAGFLARLIEKNRWIGLIGIVIILFAAAQMIWEDLALFFPRYVAPMPRPFGHLS
jgi:YjbE family integral membrane protein